MQYEFPSVGEVQFIGQTERDSVVFLRCFSPFHSCLVISESKIMNYQC
jgi:hypothetical protein